MPAPFWTRLTNQIPLCLGWSCPPGLDPVLGSVSPSRRSTRVEAYTNLHNSYVCLDLCLGLPRITKACASLNPTPLPTSNLPRTRKGKHQLLCISAAAQRQHRHAFHGSWTTAEIETGPLAPGFKDQPHLPPDSSGDSRLRPRVTQLGKPQTRHPLPPALLSPCIA